MELNENYIYIGLFLTEKSKAKIIERLSEYKEIISHSDNTYLSHCTLLHRSQENQNKSVIEGLLSLENYYPNGNFPMVATHIGMIEDKVMAIKVELGNNIPCANNTPHITLCTWGNSKPVESNNITEWKEIPRCTLSSNLKVISKSIKK